MAKILENLYKALGAKEKGFELVDTGSAAGLDGSIANAFENKKGWLGYYWAPTAILGKYEMVKLSFGVEHDKAAWDACDTFRGTIDAANYKDYILVFLFWKYLSDIWADERAAAFVRSVANGNETVPTVRIGPESMVNPSAKQVLTMLAEHAPHLLPAES